MKPRNFRGRKRLRQQRAAARLDPSLPMPPEQEHITDIKVRLGDKKRREMGE